MIKCVDGLMDYTDFQSIIFLKILLNSTLALSIFEPHRHIENIGKYNFNQKFVGKTYNIDSNIFVRS
jgi:hypothetical protein